MTYFTKNPWAYWPPSPSGFSDSGRRDATLLWISFQNTTFSDTWLIKVYEAVEKGNYWEKIELNEDIVIFDIWLGDFVIEYNSSKSRDEASTLIEGFNTPEWYLIPSNRWSFEYKWKFYTIAWVKLASKYEDERSNAIFKGIIFDVKRFVNGILK